MSKPFQPGTSVRLKAKSGLEFVVLPDDHDTPVDEVRVVWDSGGKIEYGRLPHIALCSLSAR